MFCWLYDFFAAFSYPFGNFTLGCGRTSYYEACKIYYA